MIIKVIFPPHHFTNTALLFKVIERVMKEFPKTRNHNKFLKIKAQNLVEYLVTIIVIIGAVALMALTIFKSCVDRGLSESDIELYDTITAAKGIADVK